MVTKATGEITPIPWLDGGIKPPVVATLEDRKRERERRWGGGGRVGKLHRDRTLTLCCKGSKQMVDSSALATRFVKHDSGKNEFNCMSLWILTTCFLKGQRIEIKVDHGLIHLHSEGLCIIPANLPRGVLLELILSPSHPLGVSSCHVLSSLGKDRISITQVSRPITHYIPGFGLADMKFRDSGKALVV